MKKNKIKSEAEEAPGPREQLAQFYSMEGNLPNTVSAALNTATSKSLEEKERSKTGSVTNEQRLISKIFQNEKITLEQREAIAKSILAGQYNLEMGNASENEQQGYQSNYIHPNQKSRGVSALLNRHRAPKPHFIEIVTQSAVIPIVSPKQVYASKMEYIRNAPRSYYRPPPMPRRTASLQKSKEFQSRIAHEKM